MMTGFHPCRRGGGGFLMLKKNEKKNKKNELLPPSMPVLGYVYAGFPEVRGDGTSQPRS